MDCSPAGVGAPLDKQHKRSPPGGRLCFSEASMAEEKVQDMFFEPEIIIKIILLDPLFNIRSVRQTVKEV